MEIKDKLRAIPRQKKMVAIGFCAVVLFSLLVIGFIVSIFAGGEAPAVDTEPSASAQTEASEHTTAPQVTTEATQEATEGTQATEDTQATENTPPKTGTQDEDPQTPSGGGAAVDISGAIGNGETQEVTFGIDVSKYQGTIDWAQVAASGVDFAMVRVGYRTKVTGEITVDSNAKYNMQEAQKHGIKLGAYFFSTAVTEAEAVEEANWVADYISQYRITYPVAFNCEGFSDPENRQYSLSKTQRTDLALAFLQAVGQRGYTPMFYASKTELDGQAQWETSRIEVGCKIWVAQYPAQPYPQTQRSSYTGTHAMWQYTPNGTVPGISQGVDVNIAYFGYEGTEGPKNDDTPEDVTPDPEALMIFTPVSETVTAKIETNLRDIPSQGDDSTVLYTLKNGETANRIGISDSGWSKLEFNGNIYYAVSSYLTTDLSYTPPTQTQPTEPQDTIQTQFTPVSEQVTAKEAVNLRTLPSVTDEGSQVVYTLTNGEFVTRTGINNDVGWSRVEWNGQVLYCISSYLTLAQTTE